MLGEYGLGHGLAVEAIVPLRLVDTRTTYTDLGGAPLVLDYENIHHRNETLVGLGDLQFFLHGATALGGFHLSARLGLNLPTGVVHPDPYLLTAEGLPHEHLQFGTGTFDPIVGVDAARAVGPVTVAAFAQAHVPLYEGPTGYHAGARVFGGLAASTDKLFSNGASLRLTASALHEAAERWHGLVPLDDGNQGRTDLFVGPGVTVPFATDWSASLDVRLRAWGQTVNAQLDLPLVVELSIGRLLHLENGEDAPHAEAKHPDAGAMPASAPAPGDVADLVTHGEAAPVSGVPGKWTVIDFWAEWCEPCHRLDGLLRALAAENPSLAVRRVNIVDFESPIAKQELLGVEQLPHVRVIDPSGATVYEATASPEELLAAIRARAGLH